VLKVVVVLLIGLNAACAAGRDARPQGREQASPPPPAGFTVSYRRGEGNSRKVCQLIGDTDWQTGQRTSNQSYTRAGIPGEDEGIIGDHKGQPWLYMADIYRPKQGRNQDSDSYAQILPGDPDSCISLKWPLKADGLYNPVISPTGVGGYSYPVGIFDDSDSFYLLLGNPVTMGVSQVWKSTDDGWSWSWLWNVSSSPAAKLVSVSPEADAGTLYFFGTGNYRNTGQVYLASTAAGQHKMDRPGNLRYLTGVDDKGRPLWSPNESSAAPLFTESFIPGQGLGEISVRKVQVGPHTVWLMLYNCGWASCAGAGAAQAIYMRWAPQPWGPWSASQIIVDPVLDRVAGYYMSNPKCHYPGSTRCTVFDDPSSPGNGEAGALYSPALLPNVTKQIDATTTRIYFTVSTWVPYVVVLMATDLTHN